jgi:hypothetical protein
MKRRDSLLLLGGGAAWCFSAGWVFTQQAAKVARGQNPIRLPRPCGERKDKSP